MLLINKAYLCCKTDYYCYEPFTVNLLTKRAAKWCQKLFFNVNIESIVRRTQMQTMKGIGNSLFIIEKVARSPPLELHSVLIWAVCGFSNWSNVSVLYNLPSLKYEIHNCSSHQWYLTMGRIKCNWLYSIGSPKVFGTE